ncbi:MAG TPA: hypothetical protein VGZ47_00845 [Gemmataceae bacterium]|jgi:hypothetical protein|nr:hypothetical protein [Gemmataceae bacterium]
MTLTFSEDENARRADRRARWRTGLLACGLVLGLVLGVVLAIPVYLYFSSRPNMSTNFRNLSKFTSAVQNADSVVLYEGLPHQRNEYGLFEQELKTKKTIQIHKYRFYVETLSLKNDDAKKLLDLYCDPSTFRPWMGEKSCGGYHPDFCIEWHVGQDSYQALICFSCWEIKMYGPRTELYCDVDDDALNRFKTILKAYQKNRPPRGPESLDR